MPTPRIRVIDSHTGGEPTRLVIEGGPTLGSGTLRERLERFRDRFDHFRSAIVNEPRGNDAIVGALLCQPHDPTCSAGVIFFNNVGYLHMCGHGTIGLAVTLGHLGLMEPGPHRIETPVGVVQALLHEDMKSVTVTNVPGFRHAADVSVEVEGFGKVQGDIAWGGNWFFLTQHCPYPIALSELDNLTNYTWKIRQALEKNGITGRITSSNTGQIDHIEVFGPPTLPGANSKNFVLCPGRAYDRSPCGTGTSAKVACLHADGKLKEGEIWHQESLIGSLFSASFTSTADPAVVLPHITGTAYVNADATLILDPHDPFVYGVR